MQTMNRLSRILALLLVAAAIVLAILAFSVGRDTVPRAMPAMASTAIAPAHGHAVVVAGTTLTAGEPIAAGSLRLVSWNALPEGAIDRLEAVVGRTPIRSIAAGTPVTATRLADGLALELQPGERAVAVPVDEAVGVGNRVSPGDYVDVFFSLKQARDARDDTQARLLLSRLRVLAYGDDAIATATDPTAAARGDTPSAPAARGERPASARTAVLAVPVAEVTSLLLAAQGGKLALTLRHPADRGQPDVALFAAPKPVLSTRTDLAADESGQASRPENLAFAGIDIRGLAGEEPTRTPAHARPVRLRRANGGIEVIRGTQRGRLSTLVACANPACAP
jgi:pilus assembly protein CpaB